VNNSFHPLKAGRRLQHRHDRLADHLGFHPLKAGRRQGDDRVLAEAVRVFPSPQGGSETQLVQVLALKGKRRFHPLKAGRRRALNTQKEVSSMSFPSPQGGSETSPTPCSFPLSFCVSIPSRRVGDLNR